MTLPFCHSRRVLREEANTFFCAHPFVNATDQLVTPEICRICDFWQEPAPARFRPFDPFGRHRRRTGPCFHQGDQVDWKECVTCGGHVRIKVFQCSHMAHERTTIEECRFCGDYETPLERGAVRTWAVGVTTAPRAVPTLERTLESLAAAGWSDVRLFAEPGSEVPRKFSALPVTSRHSRLGAFPNWYLGLAELVMTFPEADAYFLSQDDVLFARGLRAYLEAHLWPQPRLGVVSVYCPAPYTRNRAAGFYVEEHGRETWGALAYLFPNASARAVLGTPQVVNHRLRQTGGDHQIDGLVGQWCRITRLPYLVHEPSLAQHIGDVSTVFPGTSNSGKRRADLFLEDVNPIGL